MTTRRFLFSAWDWNPWAIALCLAVWIAFGGWRRSRSAVQNGVFAAGLLLLLLTLVSPLNALAAGALFSAHMLQHLLLLLVVPLWLVLGLPKARDDGAFVETSGFRLHPLVCWLAGLAAMWVWHIPRLCDAAIRSPGLHAIELVSLLALGTAFWWPLFGPSRRRRLAPLPGVVYLFTACLGCSLLGILIAFAPLGGVCTVYLDPPDPLRVLPLVRLGWGFTPQADQQIGGLLMWVPGCGLYLIGVLALLARWYRAPDHERPVTP